MQARINIQDATQFQLQEQGTLKVGQLFIRDGALAIRSDVNGHILDTILSGDAALICRTRRGNLRTVAVLKEGLRLTCRALSAPTAYPQLPAGMATLLDGGLAICVSFDDDDGSSNRELGRIAVVVDSGKIDFHNGELPFCFSAWELAWLNANGDSVLTLTADGGS
jgi:hypothetical protein